MSLNTYDQIDYVNRPYRATHPDYMAVLGRLHGIDPAPVETARVLELGASEGLNIIAMAMTLPKAQFTGIDLAETPIERGNQTIRELSLTNVRLLQMNLLDVQPDFGEFDYVIAHGLYAWTPPQVRDKVLAILEGNLSPNGMAFVSYNTQPGGHFRRILREAMMAAIGDVEDPRKQLDLARAALKVIADGRPEMRVKDSAIAAEAQEILERDDSSLFHDYLAGIYEPVRFLDFVAHAAQHHLAYVADTSVLDTYNTRLPDTAMKAADELSAGDHFRREQLLDCFRFRHFRRSIVCRKEAAPRPEPDSTRAVGMYVASRAKEVANEKFESPNGVAMTTNHPAVVTMLRTLAAQWPCSQRVEADDAQMVLELFKRDMVELRTIPGDATRAGARPAASAFARYQARQGDPALCTLDHRAVTVPDQSSRDFLLALDGTLDRNALAARLWTTRADVDQRLSELEALALLTA